MKIVITSPEYFDSGIQEKLKSLGSVVSRKMSREDLLKEVVDADILMIRVDTKVDSELLDKAKQLKVIASGTTGLNHIDVDYATKKGIKIFNPSGINTIATAEHTIALILSLIRKIPWAFDSLKNAEWNRAKFFGRELNGKTLGLIGMGRIGSHVAKIAKSFGMSVVVFDPYINMGVAKSLDVQIVDLDYLLSHSDVISIHAALTPETENLLTLERFKKMKKGSILINAARGKILNSNDLLTALKENIISGAAIDAVSDILDEPIQKNHPLLVFARENSNLLLTPHIGGSTEESVSNAGNILANQILEYFGG